MITPGSSFRLFVVRETSIGLYLGETPDADEKNRVLLPARQVPQGTKTGDQLEVFIYLDSQDRLIATTRTPALTLGGIGLLKVVQVTRIGAFLDWGLEKDLLLPFHEQTRRVKEGEDCLAALYLDKSGRLCATMKLYHYLSARSPYGTGDIVSARVYEISRNFGVFMAVDDRYSALIPRQEAQGAYQVGDVLKVRVTQVKEDGKLCVSTRKEAYLQMEDDAELILKMLKEKGGVLPFDDKTPPEVIQDTFGMSKNAFKRALGRLIKDEKIETGGGKTVLL